MEKLVRDLIPQIIKRSGRTPIHYQVKGAEFREFVKKKLVEEVHEFLEAESEEELADVLEVIEAIYDAFNFKKADVQVVKEKKNSERGGFKEGIILSHIDIHIPAPSSL